MRLTIEDAKVAMTERGEYRAIIVDGTYHPIDGVIGNYYYERLQLAIESAIARGETEVEVPDGK